MSKFDCSSVAAASLPSIVEGIVTADSSVSRLHENSSLTSSNHSSPISRKNSQFTFSWSSVSTSSTLLTQQEVEDDEEQEVSEENTAIDDDEGTTARYFNTYSEIIEELERLIIEDRASIAATHINRKDSENTSRIEDKLSKIVCQLASLGNLQTLEQLVTNPKYQPYVNIDKSDDVNGSANTPLIYASCFGKVAVVRFLLQLGAKVDIQDNNGWTSLMWATVNGHNDVVKVLLEHSASSNTKSAKGRTIFDLVDMSNETMISVFEENSMDRSECAVALQNRKKKLLQRRSLVLKEANAPSEQTISPAECDNTVSIEKKDSDTEEVDQLKHSEISLTSVHKFQWDRCLPDQMLVFAEENIEHLLNIAISNEIPSLVSRAEIYVSVNIIFLSARYAHYYAGRDLLQQLLSRAQQRIVKIVESNKADIHVLSFWIANLFQLLYYLKKDTGLVIATAEYQLTISELISEIYTLLTSDSQDRFSRILEAAMLDYEPIEGLEPVDFVDDWHRFFRRSRFSSSSNNSPSNNCNKPVNSDSPVNHCSNDTEICSSPTTLSSPVAHLQFSRRAILSPHTITTLLTSTLYVLSSYDVHPDITLQAMAQLFHFLSCEMFNKILGNKKYLNRSKALQIRMNLTVLEEWIREKDLSQTLTTHLEPVIQLVQLLQCLTQVVDLMSYINTIHTFHSLNPIQLKTLVLNYRYEVREPRLPEEVEKYAMQIAEDTLRHSRLQKQSQLLQQQPDYTKRSMESFKSTTTIAAGSMINCKGMGMGMSRPSSIASLSSLLKCKPLQRKRTATSSVHSDAAAAACLSTQSSESFYNCSNRSYDGTLIDNDTMSVRSRTSTVDDVIFEEEEEETPGKEQLTEKRDSNLMLPFSLPKATVMFHTSTMSRRSSSMSNLSMIQKEGEEELNIECLSDAMYTVFKEKLLAKREMISKEESVVPFIPDKWLELLDQHP